VFGTAALGVVQDLKTRK
jgi:WD40 repeat protein